MRSLLAVLVLATLAAPAAATPVRFRSVDGCYDLVSFHFNIALEDIVDTRDGRILAIPEPALFRHPDAEVHITIELGPTIAPHQPRPYYAYDRGRWYVWDAHQDTVLTPEGQPQVFSWGTWNVGERVNVQAVVPSGLCKPPQTPGRIRLND